MRRLTIGWRLTLWYGGVLGVSLVAFAAVVYAAFAGNVLNELDRALAEELAELAAAIETVPDAERLPAWLQKDFGRHEFYEIQVSTPGGEVLFRTPRLDGQRLA
ncbi:MAG: hypothetical protein EXS05_18215 [Planctomycetaceae bacterium]|nr:hypothetical protein [Planctomycetaceae bacterium]